MSSDPASLTASERVGYSFLCAGLVAFSGICSGLTLGLLSLDHVDLEVLRRSGTPTQKIQAAGVAPLVAQGHRLLVTLLLMNAAAMETLPIFLNKLVSELGAILISVTMVLFFGEIVPQSICKRFGLGVGYWSRGIVWVMLVVAFPIAWPLAKLLDWLLGEEEVLFRRAQLKALVDIHARGGGHGGELSADETTIIAGALDLTHKTAERVMTPLTRVQRVPADTPLTWASVRELAEKGHSRLPVHLPGEANSFMGLLLVKELFASVTLADLTGEGEARTVGEVMNLRALPRMNQHTPLYTALNFFQTGRSHMALVTNGTTVLFLDSTPPESALRTPRVPAGTPPAAAAALTPVILPRAASFTALRSYAHDEILGILTLEDVLEELIQEEILDETDRTLGDEGSAQTLADHQLDVHLKTPHHPAAGGASPGAGGSPFSWANNGGAALNFSPGEAGGG